MAVEAIILADIKDDETLHNDKEQVDGITWTERVECNDAGESGESEDDDDGLEKERRGTAQGT